MSTRAITHTPGRVSWAEKSIQRRCITITAVAHNLPPAALCHSSAMIAAPQSQNQDPGQHFNSSSHSHELTLSTSICINTWGSKLQLLGRRQAPAASCLRPGHHGQPGTGWWPRDCNPFLCTPQHKQQYGVPEDIKLLQITGKQLPRRREIFGKISVSWGRRKH